MTVKVGDKVRVLYDGYSTNAPKGSTQTVCEVQEGGHIKVQGLDGWGYTLIIGEYEPITDPAIGAQIRVRIEEHMGKGEYVRAVKWAQLAEQAEALENEE